MNARLLCHRCGEPIGVYEPLLTLLDGRPHETSRAAEPRDARLLNGECFHRDCFEAIEFSEPT
jgi:hypothetical protein